MEVEVRSPALSELLAEDAELEQLGNGFDFTEGPVWNAAEQYLLFSDVSGNVIRRWGGGRGRRLAAAEPQVERPDLRPAGPTRRLRARDEHRHPHRARRERHDGR